MTPDDYIDVDTDNVAEMADFCRLLAACVTPRVEAIVLEELEVACGFIPNLLNHVWAARTAARIADLIAKQVS